MANAGSKNSWRLPRWAPATVAMGGAGGVLLCAWGTFGLLVDRPSSPSDLASIAVAGATLVLAAVTGLLALFTWQALGETRLEMKNTEAALAAARDQASAMKRNAEIAEQTLLASWRPLMIEVPTPLDGHRFTIDWGRLEQPFRFSITFLNVGHGPAFVTKALFGLGSAAIASTTCRPQIVYQDGTSTVTFEVNPHGPDRSIATALADTANDHLYVFKAVVEYHDVSRQLAWRTTGRAVRIGNGHEFELTDVAVDDIEQADSSTASP